MGPPLEALLQKAQAELVAEYMPLFWPEDPGARRARGAGGGGEAATQAARQAAGQTGQSEDPGAVATARADFDGFARAEGASAKLACPGQEADSAAVGAFWRFTPSWPLRMLAEHFLALSSTQGDSECRSGIGSHPRCGCRARQKQAGGQAGTQAAGQRGQAGPEATLCKITISYPALFPEEVGAPIPAKLRRLRDPDEAAAEAPEAESEGEEDEEADSASSSGSASSHDSHRLAG